MPRSLPWTNHQNAQGERPLFFAELELAHRTFSLATYDLVPGPIQGRVAAWDTIKFHQRGAQDSIELRLLNSPYPPSSSLGKAIRCRGREGSAGKYDGSFAYWSVDSGDPFDYKLDHAFMLLLRAWMLTLIGGTDAIICIRKQHFRFLLSAAGTITFQVANGPSWVTQFVDAGGYREGELCAIGFSHDADAGTYTYFRRSDTGDATNGPSGGATPAPAADWPIIFSGDSSGLVANAGVDGLYLPWVDLDEARWWSRELTFDEFKAAARRILNPAEAEDASLVAWSGFDEGTGTTFGVATNTSANVSGHLSYDDVDSFIAGLSYPDWISGITRDRIDDHIDGDHPIEGATVRIKVTFGDPVTNAPVTLFMGEVGPGTVIDPREARLDCVDISQRADVEIGRIVDRALFPNAPDATIGKMLPLVFGAVTDLVALHVRSASSTTLTASMLTADTTADVGDTSAFPSSGTIIIGEEEIDYTGKTAASFTGLTRGANGTVATSHVTGQQVIELDIETYSLAGHAATITNVRKVNSRGEILAVDPADIFIVNGDPTSSGVIFLRPPTALVRGDGSKWLAIDLDGPSGFDNSIDPERACALNAAWEETNFAQVNQPQPKFSGIRSIDFAGPALSAGILNAYVVVEHHNTNTLGAGKSVEVRLEVAGVPVLVLGTLTPQTNTPDRALEQGRFHSESEGFEASHQHMIPGSMHDHDLGQESLSTIIRPLGSSFGFCVSLGGSGYPGGVFAVPTPLGPPFGQMGPFYTATRFYDEIVNSGMVDDNIDTFGPFPDPTNAKDVSKFPFANLQGTNREIKQAKLTLIMSGNGAGRRVDLVIRGQRYVTIPDTQTINTASGTGGRRTETSSVIDLTTQGFLIADLLRPDSYIEITDVSGSGTMEVWELYASFELEEVVNSTRIVRPRFDNWPKPLNRLRDGRYDTFEPHSFTYVPAGVDPQPPTGPAVWRTYAMNPNEPIVGPDLPWNDTVQPDLKFFFTDIEEPFARLDRACLFIAHTNTHDDGPHVPTLGLTSYARWAVPPAPLVSSPPDPWVPSSTPGAIGPVFLVRFVIRGTPIAAFTFRLDMSTGFGAVVYDPALLAPGQRPGVYSAPRSQAARTANGYIVNRFTASQARVESTSGWISLLGQAPGGSDYTVQDLVANDSYIQVVMPPRSLSSWVDQISSEHTNPGSDPDFLTQIQAYELEPVADIQKFFDVRIEYESSQIEEEAQVFDIGPTAAASALSHSSLSWFDITAFFLLSGSWQGALGVELVCEAQGFDPADFVRLLRCNVVVEYGEVSEEKTNVVIADVDSGDGGNPIDHVERIFDDFVGSAYKDTAAFAAAQALVRTDAAGAVLEPIMALELARRILRQYSCSGHWETGLFVPLFKPALSSVSAATPAMTINDLARQTIRRKNTPVDEIVNQVLVLYARSYLRGGWSAESERNSTGSQSVYGRVVRAVEEADWIVTQAAAEAFGDNLLDYGDHVSTILAFATYLSELDRVRGDVVELDHYFWRSAALEVLEMSIHPGGVGDPPRIEFVTADRKERPS